MSRLVTEFSQHFQIVIATTPALREEVYKIRYQVYCRELAYEPENRHPNGLEHDTYDARSIHCLLLHRPTRLYAGCVRLVLPEKGASKTNLPFERVLSDRWQSSNRAFDASSFRGSGEVSRLAVPALFRKWQEEFPFTEHQKRYFPLIPLGLCLGATYLALEIKLNRVFALMEPRLVRHLSQFRIRFQQVGNYVEFHGRRGLYQVTKEAVLYDMTPMSFILLQTLQSQVRQQFAHSDILRCAV